MASGDENLATLYVESSALLRIVLEGDADLSRRVAEYPRLFTSALTLIEATRALSRALREDRINAEGHGRAHGRLAGFVQSTTVAEITRRVRERAALDFPVEPVRSLDAIHLATMTVWRETLGAMVVASCDDRIVRNARALGFECLAMTNR